MDALAGFLDGPRARGAFVLRASLDPPWSLRVQDEAPLTVVTVARGTAWIVADHEPPVRLGPGDVALARGPAPYTVADDPATPPQVVIDPGQRCRTPDGEDLHEVMALGVRSWGNSPDGSTVLLVGTYETAGELGKRLLDALPATAVVRGDELDSPLAGLLAEEITRDEPGQDAVLDRLLDLVLVAVLRTWFAGAGEESPSWWRAGRDPVVGPALRLLQQRPADPWTVATLAAAVGVSRAALARRFTDLVGEAPMAFLTGWRLALAADLLCEPDATVTSVASQVGYSGPFALSNAFKRVRGMSPRQHRAAALAT